LIEKVLLDCDRFDRANVDARAAIATGIFVTDGDIALHFERVERATVNTFATTGTFFFVNNRCHFA
jgi:hypothetical protein